MSMPTIIPSTTTRCQAITDIIESVALQQTALSHILNAEGEKLQAVIAKPNIPLAELLATNRSVKNMIEAVSRLEMLLQNKLSLFEDALTVCPPPTQPI